MDRYLRFNKKCKLALLLLLSVVGMTKADVPAGAINGIFSVSENTQVRFSQGNLQFQASTNTWRFAENQWDYMDFFNEDISSVNTGWIDLFGYGTSGYNHGATCYQPWSNYTEGNAYYAYNLFDQTGQADWGYNPISNGGNIVNMGWRTLTIDEWNYVFNLRSTISGIRYAKAKVNNVNGVILLPNDWIASTYSLNNTNSREASFNSNVISAELWTILETAGAVFLPAAGRRWALTPNGCGSYGYYWSASVGNDNYSYIVYFRDNNLSTMSQITRSYGLSVRLVCPIENSSIYGINAIPNPVEGGTVNGMGDYDEGATCTLIATANEGYTFVNWTENGNVVSTNAEYTFTVTGERTLVANFIPPYFTIESLSNNNTITFNIPSGITSTQLTSVSYSTDGINWTTLEINNTNQSISVTLGVGEKVYFKGLGIQYCLNGSANNASTISSTGNIKVYGNIMSLLYGDDFVSQTEFPIGSTYTFRDLFYGNTRLVSTEDLVLPVSTLVNDCYSRMFFGCTALTSAPALPAVTLASNCYSLMFRGCSSLLSAPALPATTLSSYCYWSMFNGCTSLTTAPALPATTLASNCYYFMFSGCTSLTTAPDLPATTLVGSCYSSMFSGCTSLTIAPVLPAASLTSGCYSNMFSGCSSLAEITCLATDNSASYCTNNWLNGVALSGTFHKNPEMQSWLFNSPSGIPEGWTVIGGDHEIVASANPLEGGTVTGAGTYEYGTTVTLTAIPTAGYSFVNWMKNGEVVSTEASFSFTFTEAAHYVANFVAPYFTLESLSNNNTITLSIPGEFSSAQLASLSFSTDGTNWNNVAYHNYDLIVTLNIGEKVYIKGVGKQYGYEDEDEDEIYYCNISATGDFIACGNIMSLLYGDNFANKTSFPSGSDYTFYGLFSGNTHLVSAENLYLPATIMSPDGYEIMFEGCTSLTTAPALPATSLATYCYSEMFTGCTSLTTAPALPATSLATVCYSEMFTGCTSLTTAPALPATSLATYCYSEMFSGCTSLTTAPALPATSLAPVCYSEMFTGCTSLTTAPELPATTLASNCYSKMFSGCTSLTTAPALPATSLATYCYSEMFTGCTSLTTAPDLPATILTSGCYDNMFDGCTSLLLTPDLPATTLADGCYAYMFFGCTSLTMVPELPAINLPNPTSSWVRGCYQSMFEGCNSLTTAPELPATILTTRCYKDMFKNCSSLNEITCLATVISATDCTTDWLSGVASTGTFHKNPEMLDWPIDSPSGIPEGWTVQGNRYEVVATANPSEGGIITGAGMYDEGSQVNLTATPNEGYIFVNWTENGEVVSTDASYSFTVTSDRNLVANFTETSNTNHWTTITGTQYNLTMSGIIYIDGVAQTSTALEIGAFCGDECRGSARAQYFPPSNEYVVSLAVVSNQQSGETIIFRLYDHDTQQEFPSECVNSITFVANANFGEMGNWYPFAFNNSVAVTATVTPEGAGTVEGTGDYLLGTSCTLTATANTGYTFVNWTENGEVVSTNNPYTFTVNGAVELTANFSLNSYSITASSNPTTGGTIDGTGTYYHFSSCTLTATANTGYVFQSWSVAGEVVSTDNPYTFTVNSAAELTANFSLISYDITATSNPTTGGIIDGTGTYEHFSSCTLTAMANTGYAFRFWSVNGETVSTDNPYTFTVSGAVELTANFDAQETTTLDNGWTWWSTSIEMSGIDGLTMLEESLGHNGLTIKSANKFVQNYYPNTGYDYWFGQLTSDDFNNESSYMIQTSTSCEVTMTGMYANPSDHPIQLYPNWTWIGYPCGIQQSAASAFAGFIPTHNDLLKGQYAFSTYYDNYGWFPEFSLTPGQGYMYQSLASGNRTLTFANGSKADPVPTNGEDRYWRNNVHAYADNMNVIAVVTVSGEEQHGEDIELGAFVNGECRGSAMLKHFQPTDRWYAMLTVTGADGDEIEFGVIDRNRGMASMTSNSSLVFQTNTVVGELDEPYVIDFGTLGCIENGIEEPMHIYPNPIERNTRFTIAFPEAETLSDIFIVNMMGEVVAHETNKDKMTALQTPGVYTVKVVCRSGKVFVGKLVVR